MRLRPPRAHALITSTLSGQKTSVLRSFLRATTSGVDILDPLLFEEGTNMRVGNCWAAALVVAVGGTFVPGCGSSEGDYEPFGRICAAPYGGGTYCVPAKEGPASAWREAEAEGSPPPIEMWADLPAEMTRDDLVKSEQNLLRWFATIDKVVEYVRDERRDAESYKWSMQGHLGIMLENARDRQKELLLEEPVDAMGSFKAALTEKASVEKDPLVATIANDKQSMGAVQEVFEKVKVDAGPFAAQYARLVKDFSAYCATEAAETEGYKTLAADASKAGIDGLDGIEQAVLTAALSASAKPNDLMLSGMQLSAQIQQFELASQEAIKPHSDFMATHGAALPDMTSTALRSINAMLGYVQRRVARSDATATSIVMGIGMRRKALEMLAASPAVRAYVADANLQKAESVFSETSKARVNAIQGLPPVSAKLGLPFLGKRYDELTRLVQMQPLCAPGSASWRGAGCVALKDKFEGAAIYLKTTLPAQLSTGLAAMKAAGVDAALLDAAKAKLDAGDIKAAAVLHDAALRSAEGI
jgi:hypothetical protein